jgi:hypothetical protein
VDACPRWTKLHESSGAHGRSMVTAGTTFPGRLHTLTVEVLVCHIPLIPGPGFGGLHPRMSGRKNVCGDVGVSDRRFPPVGAGGGATEVEAGVPPLSAIRRSRRGAAVAQGVDPGTRSRNREPWMPSPLLRLLIASQPAQSPAHAVAVHSHPLLVWMCSSFRRWTSRRSHGSWSSEPLTTKTPPRLCTVRRSGGAWRW